MYLCSVFVPTYSRELRILSRWRYRLEFESGLGGGLVQYYLIFADELLGEIVNNLSAGLLGFGILVVDLQYHLISHTLVGLFGRRCGLDCDRTYHLGQIGYLNLVFALKVQVHT